MTLLTMGPVHTLTEDEIYALPGRKCMILSDSALEIALLEAGPFTALVGANTTGIETVAAFVRCTGSDAVVIVKAA